MTTQPLARPHPGDASIGAHLVATLSRWLVKRNAVLWHDVDATRRLFDSALFTRAWVAGKVGFTAATGAPVPGEWVTPRDRAAGERTVLHLHGGGYQSGSPVTVRGLTGGLARAASARVFVPDYRRAPEHHFPCAYDDALAAYRWLLSTGVSPSRLAVSGDSAGGGLALALVQALRDAGDPLPACVVMISPWTDMLGAGDSNTDNAAACAIFHTKSVGLAAATYLGGADPHDVRASPVYGDMRGLPPMLLHVGADEIIRDDSVRAAEAARRAGVRAEVVLWPVVPHAWQLYGTLLREARESLAELGAFITAHTG